MADDYRSEICSTGGGTWWNPNRSTTAGAGARFEEAGAVSCSTTITDLEAKSRSYDDSAGSGSGNSDIGSSISDSTLQLPLFSLSASPIDWSQALLRGSEKSITSLNNMAYYHHEQQTFDSSQVHVAATEDSGINSFNQSFILDQSRVGSCPNSTHEGVDTSYDSNLGQVTYNYPSAMVPGLLETSTKTQQPIYNEQSTTNYAELMQPSWNKFPQFLHSPSSKQNQSNQLQLCNDTPYWNSSIQSQYVAQSLEPKSTTSRLIERLSRDSAQVSRSVTCKKSDSETAFKKPRIETPSPLPTFKVRKEKLGDRITALQQLVSPFGKTDTASVLHEAIEYIKFLHDQVAVLSTPYLKNGSPNPVQLQEQPQVSGISNESDGPKQDLRSRGLCLVPVASTYPVASEITTDFWHPTFGGTFR